MQHGLINDDLQKMRAECFNILLVYKIEVGTLRARLHHSAGRTPESPQGLLGAFHDAARPLHMLQSCTPVTPLVRICPGLGGHNPPGRWLC